MILYDNGKFCIEKSAYAGPKTIFMHSYCPISGAKVAEDMAQLLNATAIAIILDGAHGNFDCIDSTLQEAMSLYGTLSWEKQEQKIQKEAKRRARKAAEHHKQIIDEIEDLMGDTESFTVEDILEKASAVGYATIRTPEMYRYHLYKEWCESSSRIESALVEGADLGKTISVVLRDCKTVKSIVLGYKKPRYGWRFVK